MRYSKDLFAQVPKSRIEELINQSDKLKMKTITLGFPDIFGRFMGKKFDVDYFNSGPITKGSNACNYLLGCDLTMTPLPNTKLSSYDLGYGDFNMKPDHNSVRKINYINGNPQFLFFSDLFNIETNQVVGYAPRQLLRQAEESLYNLGYKLKVDCEINFTAFNEKFRKNVGSIDKMQPLTEHSNLANVFYSQSYEKMISLLRESLLYSSIPVSGIYGDSGLGQFKICLSERDPIEFSDNITLLKLVSAPFNLIIRLQKKLLMIIALHLHLWQSTIKTFLETE